MKTAWCEKGSCQTSWLRVCDRLQKDAETAVQEARDELISKVLVGEARKVSTKAVVEDNCSSDKYIQVSRFGDGSSKEAECDAS